MIIYTAHFGHPKFARLLTVFARSVAANCPGARFVAEDIGPPTGPIRRPIHVTNNTHKLRAWYRFATMMTEPTIFMDCDMLVLKDLAPAFDDDDFEIAYCVRPGTIRTNAGVVFARPTMGAVRFMWGWHLINETLIRTLDCRTAFNKAIRGHGGLNQAALDFLLEWGADRVVLKELPCATWNSVDQTWDQFDPETTAVLHMKGALRRSAMGPGSPGHGSFKGLAAMAGLWREYEDQPQITQMTQMTDDDDDMLAAGLAPARVAPEQR